MRNLLQTTQARFGFGQFLGNPDVHSEVPGFSVANMVPTVRAEDVPTHTHEQASFIFIAAGRYITEACSNAICEPQTLIYNPVGVVHRDRFHSTTGRFLAISISSDTLRQAAQLAPLPDAPIVCRAPLAVFVAQRLVRECAQWEDSSAFIGEGLCLELLGKIAKVRDGVEREMPRWLCSAKDMLRDTCCQNLRVSDVAHAVGVHPIHLARTFRHFFQCTPAEYVRHCRLERASTLLAESELPLAETALEAGFADQSHFTKAFGRGFGLSPRQYRRMFSH